MATPTNPAIASPPVDDEQERFDRFIPIGKRRYGPLPNEKEVEKNQNFTKWLHSLAGSSSYYKAEHKRWQQCQFIGKIVLILGTLCFLGALAYVIIYMAHSNEDTDKKSEI